MLVFPGHGLEVGGRSAGVVSIAARSDRDNTDTASLDVYYASTHWSTLIADVANRNNVDVLALFSEMLDTWPDVDPAGYFATVMKSILFCWGCGGGEFQELIQTGC